MGLCIPLSARNDLIAWLAPVSSLIIVIDFTPPPNIVELLLKYLVITSPVQTRSCRF